jgi:hypothetical protein
MGCDAPVGWNDVEDKRRAALRQRGWQDNGLGEPRSCLRCGADVRYALMDVPVHKNPIGK